MMADEQPRSPLKPDTVWHSRGYLPHWEAGEEAQAIFFRLADSMPRHLRESWAVELQGLPDDTQAREFRKRIESFLDAGHGDAFLARDMVGPVIEGALLHFDAERYRLHAWCVMPNHVHALFTPMSPHSLSSIVHSWKSFTAKKINAVLGRTGQVWFEEYFDRKIRNEKHFEDARHYIEHNPVKARLCREPLEWRYSSALRGGVSACIDVLSASS
jgi:REP element-mobilizing transposase RayT